MAEGTAVARAADGRAVRSPSWWLVNYGVVGTVLVFIVVFSILRPETFPTLDNAQTIVATQGVLAILALGVLVPLIVGEFDLSVANTLSLTAVVSASLISGGMDVVPALGISLVCGAAIGGVNAFLVVTVGISSFITTLGSGVFLAGLTAMVAGNETIYENIGSGFMSLGNTVLFDFLPIAGLYVILLALVLWYVLARTPLGRQMFATGMGRDAARLAGIRTNRLIVLAFVIAGVFAAAAGVLHAAQLGSASPGVGDAYLLPAYAGAFLGSTTIQAGRFNVVGTLVGIALLAIGITGLQLLGASNYVSNLFNGAALIVAIAIAQIGARASRRGKA